VQNVNDLMQHLNVWAGVKRECSWRRRWSAVQTSTCLRSSYRRTF